MKNRKNAAIRKPEILENYYQVIIEEGIEGASIGKVAKRMDCHPSLLIHYFKTKKNMTLELCDLLLEKYLASEHLDFSHISNLEDRFNALIDTIFTESWSKTVDPGVQYCFYYLSFRNPDIQERFNAIFKRFRDYLSGEMEIYKRAGIINVEDLDLAIDTIITLMEGLEFHSKFLANGNPFEEFAEHSKRQVLALLKGTTVN
jgi:AcrR family transcriptional regulator